MNTQTAAHQATYKNQAPTPRGSLLPSQATLRFIGHMGRNGGNQWALKAAEQYFPEGHMMLKAYQSRCQIDNSSAQNQSQQVTKPAVTYQANPSGSQPKLNLNALISRPEYWHRRVKLNALIPKRR